MGKTNFSEFFYSLNAAASDYSLCKGCFYGMQNLSFIPEISPSPGAKSTHVVPIL